MRGTNREDIPEGAEDINLEDVREGERLLLQYRSRQSGNVVQYKGEVKEASRLGDRTSEFVFTGDNGTDYDVNHRMKVSSTGEKGRKLSKGKAEVFRLEALEIEEWDDEIVFGAVRVFREKREVFDCPFCGSEDDASVNSINEPDFPDERERTVTVSCGSCREVRVMDDQPVEMALKVTR